MLRLFVSLPALWVSLDILTIPLRELFEVGVIPMGKEAVSPALKAGNPPAGSGEPEGYPLPCLGLGSRVSILKIRLHSFAKI